MATVSNAHQTRVPASALHIVVAHIYQAGGMGETDAALMADSHIGSELRGSHSHGILRVPGYGTRLREGGVDPQGQPSLSRHFGACLVVDGGNSMGQIGCRYAMELLLDRAEHHAAVAPRR